MKQFLVEYIRTGVSRPEQKQVGAYNDSDAIRRVRDEYGFNNVTIKSCREVR